MPSCDAEARVNDEVVAVGEGFVCEPASGRAKGKKWRKAMDLEIPEHGGAVLAARGTEGAVGGHGDAVHVAARAD